MENTKENVIELLKAMSESEYKNYLKNYATNVQRAKIELSNSLTIDEIVDILENEEKYLMSKRIYLQK